MRPKNVYTDVGTRLATVLILTLISAASAASAEETAQEWTGVVRASKMDKSPPGLLHAYLETTQNFWRLKGDAVAPIKSCKKGRCWVVRGVLEADSKSILVSEMKEQTEWTGDISTVREEKYAPVRPVLKIGKRSWVLTGSALAHAKELLKGGRWCLKGKESDDTKSIETTEMARWEGP